MGALNSTRTRLLILLCILVGSYGIYTAASGWYRTTQLQHNQDAAEERVQELYAKQAYLQGVKEYVASDAYVEQQARRQLGYGREGETVFVVTSPAIEQAAQLGGSWWERLFPR
jgi:cell division protein FtsB